VNQATAEFEIAGHTYRAGKLNTFQQFHISRRLAPVLSGLASDNPTGFLPAVAEAVAHMPEADCDYILHTCLAGVRRNENNVWAPIAVGDGKALMFADIDLTAMMQIVVAVIQENLSNFFSARVAMVTEATPEAI